LSKNSLQVITRRTSKKGKKSLRFLIVGGPLDKLDTSALPESVELLGTVADAMLKRTHNKNSIGLLPFFEETPLYGGIRIKAMKMMAQR